MKGKGWVVFTSPVERTACGPFALILTVAGATVRIKANGRIRVLSYGDVNTTHPLPFIFAIVSAPIQ